MHGLEFPLKRLISRFTSEPIKPDCRQKVQYIFQLVTKSTLLLKKSGSGGEADDKRYTACST